MTVCLAHPMITSFEQKGFQRLEAFGLSVPELAAHLGWPEPALRTLCHASNPRLSELEQLSQALRVPPTYLFNGSFNLAGIGNTLTIEVNGEAARELTDQLGSCRRSLEQSQQLVATKDEIIALLRGSNHQTT